MKSIPITDISGFQIGYADNAALGTGCTAILCRAGAVAGCDVRGGGPATRDTDLLAPKNTVEAIHGVLLSGGSAFGLEAGTGVMKYLSEQGIGMPVTPGVSVPIVVQADIFDLGVGDPAWPDVAMGYAAAKDSEHNVIRHGNAGAGMGASVGKILGPEKAMKSGIGTAAFECGPLKVGAVVVVNACGDVFAMDSDTRLAGVQSDQSMEEIMGMLYETEAARAMEQAQDAEVSRKNTTIGCVLTNGQFTKAQMNKLASLAQNGLSRTIRPVNMTLDGDTLFAMTTGEVPAPLDVVGMMAVKAVAKAVETAVNEAETAYGLKGRKSQ